MIYGLIKGAFRGLIGELTSIVGFVGGILAAFYFSDFVFNVLARHIQNPGIAVRALAFILIFIGVVVLVKFTGKALTKAFDLIALGALNHILGAAFGSMKWLLITVVAVYFFAMLQEEANIIQPKTLSGSKVYQKLLEFSSYLSEYLDKAAGYQRPAAPNSV